MNKYGLIIFISLLALLGRFLPHLPNFSPLYAILIFSGAYASRVRWAFLPLLALLLSDFFLGFYAWPIMLAVYLSLAINIMLGRGLRKNLSALGILNASLLSALLFFVITNTAVWYFGTWYSHDTSGLMYCYTLAIPFFKTTLMSTVLYSGLMFGAYEGIMIAKKLVRKKITN